MTTLLRIVRLYTLAAWIGGELFFVLVAAIAFRTLPDAHSAGLIVRGSLLDLHRIGICGGIVYLLATLGLLAVRRGSRVHAIELLLGAIMLVLTFYSQLSIIPRMETDRLTLGGDVAAASPTAPARLDFNRLHSLSVDVEGAVFLGGLILLALAAVEPRQPIQPNPPVERR